MAIHRVAVLLLVPYLAWVSFAALLNAAIVRLNQEQQGTRNETRALCVL